MNFFIGVVQLGETLMWENLKPYLEEKRMGGKDLKCFHSRYGLNGCLSDEGARIETSFEKITQGG